MRRYRDSAGKKGWWGGDAIRPFEHDLWRVTGPSTPIVPSLDVVGRACYQYSLFIGYGYSGGGVGSTAVVRLNGPLT